MSSGRGLGEGLNVWWEGLAGGLGLMNLRWVFEVFELQVFEEGFAS